MKTKNNKLFDKQLLRESLRASVRKLAPRTMIKNPIMFTVEIVTAMMLTMLFYILLSGDTSQGTFGYNLVIFLVLLATLLFANFAEAIAEARGKAQADSLRKPRGDSRKLVAGGSVQIISSSALKKNDIFECVAGDTIPPTARSSKDWLRSTKARSRAKAHGDPRSGRRQKFGDGRYEGAVGPYPRQSQPHSPARASSTKMTHWSKASFAARKPRTKSH